MFLWHSLTFLIFKSILTLLFTLLLFAYNGFDALLTTLPRVDSFLHEIQLSKFSKSFADRYEANEVLLRNSCAYGPRHNNRWLLIKNRGEYIRFLKVGLCSDHEVFFHVFLLIRVCSCIFSFLKLSTVAGTYFSMNQKCIILVTYAYMHKIVGKKNKKEKGKLNVTSPGNIDFSVL